MKLNKINIEYKSRTTKYNLIPIGDIHLGNKGCDLQRLRDLIRWISNQENIMVIGMGDYLDCINYTDPRFDPCTIENKYLADLSNLVPMQTEDFIRLIEPISDKIIGLHRGNHEENIRARYHWDVMHEIHKEYPDIPLLEDCAVTRLHFLRKTGKQGNGTKQCFDIFSQHGRAGGFKGGNKINRLEDFIGFIDADIYLMAHAHIKETEMKTQLYVDDTMHLRHKKKLLAVTGAFLRGYTEDSSSYIEKAMLPPTDLGVIKITIIPDKNDIHISI